MRTIPIFLLLAIVSGCGRSNPSREAPAPPAKKTLPTLSSNGMTISSSAFVANGPIPERYTCDGAGISPPLAFGGVPANARALALVVVDPDAPSGSFDHWVVWNIPPGVAAVAEGQPPAGGTEGTNGFGQKGWGGPCPPNGEHHYVFNLYALDAPVGGAGEIAKHAFAQARLVGVYKRK